MAGRDLIERRVKAMNKTIKITIVDGKEWAFADDATVAVIAGSMFEVCDVSGTFCFPAANVVCVEKRRG